MEIEQVDVQTVAQEVRELGKQLTEAEQFELILKYIEHLPKKVMRRSK